MKRSVVTLCIFVLVLLLGCQNTSPTQPLSEAEVTTAPSSLDPAHTIYWGSWLNYMFSAPIAFDQKESKVNRLLQNKGFPWRVKFIDLCDAYTDGVLPRLDGLTAAMKRIKGEKLPLDIVNASFASPYISSYTHFVDDGMLTELTPYWAAPQAEAFRARFPEEIWESLKIRGEDYLIPGLSFFSPEAAGSLAVKTALMEKYGIQADDLSSKLWLHKDILQKVWEGEKADPNFVLLQAEWQWMAPYPRQTPAYALHSELLPIVYNEDSKKFENCFANVNFQKAMSFFSWMDKEGWLNPDRMTLPEPNYFMIPFGTVPPMSDTSEYTLIEFDAYPLHNIYSSSWGITAWSEKKQAAFDLLQLVHTDAELYDTLTWDESTGATCVTFSAWNPSIEGAQTERRELYKRRQKSDIFGWTLETAAVQDKIEAIVTYMMEKQQELYSIDLKLEVLDTWIKDLEALGIDEIIAYFNQQLEERGKNH